MFAGAARSRVLLAEAWATPFQLRWRRAWRWPARAGSGRSTTSGPSSRSRSRPTGQGTSAGTPRRAGVRCSTSVSTASGRPSGSGCRAGGGVGERLPGTDRHRHHDRRLVRLGGRPDGVMLASFELPERQLLEVAGTGGRLVIDDRAHTGGVGASTIELGASGRRARDAPPARRRSVRADGRRLRRGGPRRRRLAAPRLRRPGIARSARPHPLERQLTSSAAWPQAAREGRDGHARGRQERFRGHRRRLPRWMSRVRDPLPLHLLRSVHDRCL